MKHCFKLLMLFALTIVGSCKEEEDPNAPKLFAYVDGQYWEDELPGQLKARIQNGQIIVVSAVCGFQFYVSGLTEGTYKTGRNHSSFSWTKAFNCDVLSHSNITDDDTGQIEITAVDRSRSTVSGKFSYTAIHLASGKKVNVTGGEFRNVPFTEAVSVGVFDELELDQNGRVLAFTETKNFINGGTLYITGKHPEGDVLDIDVPGNFSIGTHNVEGDYGAAGSLFVKAQYAKGSQKYPYAKPGSTISITTYDVLANRVEGTFDLQLATSNAASAVTAAIKGRFKGKLNP